jgi:hypothetical protein
VDRNMDTKIFEDSMDYWKEEEAENLNSEFSEEKQLELFLTNEKSPYDLKAVMAVKKLDNSIYMFQHLADKAKDIVRLKTKIYITNKKNPASEEFDQAA